MLFCDCYSCCNDRDVVTGDAGAAVEIFQEDNVDTLTNLNFEIDPLI